MNSHDQLALQVETIADAAGKAIEHLEHRLDVQLMALTILTNLLVEELGNADSAIRARFHVQLTKARDASLNNAVACEAIDQLRDSLG